MDTIIAWKAGLAPIRGVGAARRSMLDRHQRFAFYRDTHAVLFGGNGQDHAAVFSSLVR